MKHLTKHFHRLSGPEKTLVVSLVLCFLFTFFTWFYQVSITAVPNIAGKYEDVKTFSAYNGITAVTGWFYSIFVLAALASIGLSTSHKQVQQFLEKHYWFYLFLTGQALFLLILTALIYTSYAMQYTRAGIEFGLVFAIISNTAALFAAHFFFLQKRKSHVRKTFASQMQGAVHVEPEVVKNTTTPEPKKVEKDKEEEASQMSFADYDIKN